MAYCQDEEFHCMVREHKHLGDVYKVVMGCQQYTACEREFLNNHRFFGVNMPDIAGFNTGIYRQCFSEDAAIDTSICRQCCATNECNLVSK